MARIRQRYLAIIADMVRSRDVAPARRPLLQRRFADLIVSLNRDYCRTIAARFVITLGDEFQGLLHASAIIPDLIWRLEQEFPQRELRLGIGLGALDTPLQKSAINIDGPALHAARAAIQAAKQRKVLGGVFRGFGHLDPVLDGIARQLWFQRARWTASQRMIANLLRQGFSQVKVARKLRIRPQVVSRQAIAAGWPQYLGAETAWRMILHRQVDPLLESRHGASQRH